MLAETQVFLGIIAGVSEMQIMDIPNSLCRINFSRRMQTQESVSVTVDISLSYAYTDLPA